MSQTAASSDSAFPGTSFKDLIMKIKSDEEASENNLSQAVASTDSTFIGKRFKDVIMKIKSDEEAAEKP